MRKLRFQKNSIGEKINIYTISESFSVAPPIRIEDLYTVNVDHWPPLATDSIWSCHVPLRDHQWLSLSCLNFKERIKKGRKNKRLKGFKIKKVKYWLKNLFILSKKWRICQKTFKKMVINSKKLLIILKHPLIVHIQLHHHENHPQYPRNLDVHPLKLLHVEIDIL